MARTNRRGFFGSLFGKRPFRRACFAVQVVINAYGDEELRQKIHDVLAEDVEQTPSEKKRFYRRLAAVVIEAEPFFEQACFEYTPDDDADEIFTEWVSEIEAEIAVEDEETGDEVDGMHRLDSEKRYVVFTMVFLLVEPHPFADKYDDEDDEDYTRPIVAELIDSVNFLDFDTGVAADAVFLMPGNEKDGFSWSDLADEGWSHLHMLRS